MKKLVWLLVGVLGTLAAGEYDVDCGKNSNRIFFAKSAAEKEQLIQRVKFITALPGSALCQPNSPLNDTLLYQALRQRVRVIGASQKRTSIYQVAEAKKLGFEVCLVPANDINEIVSAVLKNPDYILCDPKFDIEKLQAVLREDLSTRIKPFPPTVNWDDPKDAVFNFNTVTRRSEGTELRVMSYNMLAQTYFPQAAACFRAADAARVIKHLAPDVAGLQEIDLLWYAYLDDGRLSPYEFVEAPVSPYPPAIALIYNAKKFRVIDNGFFPFTDKWQKALNWALFEEISTGRRFILTDTHWAPGSPERRMENAREMVKCIKILQSKYSCPIISTGDFNSVADSAEFSTFTRDAGMSDAITTAPKTENADISSYRYHEYLAAPFHWERSHIDHVVYSAGVTPLSARLVLDKELTKVSDHFPLIVDFKY